MSISISRVSLPLSTFGGQNELCPLEKDLIRQLFVFRRLFTAHNLSDCFVSAVCDGMK